MKVRDVLHHAIEAILPWYDPAEKARRDARTEAIRQRSIDVRMKVEQIRAAYRESGERQQRR